jgi:hypothetical protein
VFRHNDHGHPFLGPIQGQCAGSFVAPTRGETEPTVWYEVQLTVTDSGQPLGATGALTHSRTVDVHPNLATITLATAPVSDLNVELDTSPTTAPTSAQSVVGLIRTIGAPDGQVAAGRTWTWTAWSDGGTRQHEIATPVSNTTYTATFGCNVIEEVTGLIVDKLPADRLRMTWQPLADTCLATGSQVYRVYASSNPRPAVGAGQFPVDPPFALIGTSGGTSLDHDAPLGNAYFLVVAVGTDQRDGPAGSYGPP